MLIVPNEFDANFISSLFYPDDFRENDLGRINNGECYDWAYYAVRTFHHLPLKLYSTFAHAYIMYQDKFYDSETPHGEMDWLQLNTNRWWRGDPQLQPLDEFMHFWNRNGGGRTYHWDFYLEKNLSQKLGFDYIPRELQLSNS